MDEENLQALALQRVERAAARHKRVDGIEPEVECMVPTDAGGDCDNVPEFHIEQLDGECMFVCWDHRFNALAEYTHNPLIHVDPKSVRDN